METYIDQMAEQVRQHAGSTGEGRAALADLSSAADLYREIENKKRELDRRYSAIMSQHGVTLARVAEVMLAEDRNEN